MSVSSDEEWVEATGEWLAKITNTEYSEELTYVPSYLSKVGISQIDVVDRLDWLRERDTIESRAALMGSSAAMRTPSSVMVMERPSEVIEEAELPAALVTDKDVDPLTAPVELSPSDCSDHSLTSDHEDCGFWEWAESIEETLEESFRLLLTPEPGLHEFNKLASLKRSATKNTRGKRARSSGRPIT